MRTVQNLGNHELIGLDVSVYKASTLDKVAEGRVVDETKNTFVLETLKKESRVAKHGNLFDFDLEGESVRIDGDRISFRPEDRTKKVKKVVR